MDSMTSLAPPATARVARIEGSSPASALVALAPADVLCLHGTADVQAVAGSARVLGYTLQNVGREGEGARGGRAQDLVGASGAGGVDELRVDIAAGSEPPATRLVSPPWDSTYRIVAGGSALEAAPELGSGLDSKEGEAAAAGLIARLQAAGEQVAAVVQVRQVPGREHSLDNYDYSDSLEVEVAVTKQLGVPGVRVVFGVEDVEAAGAAAPAEGGGADAGAGALSEDKAATRREKKRPGALVVLRRSLVVPPRWNAIAAAVAESHVGVGGPTSVVVCGAKGVGKSTYCRLLTNTLLSNGCPGVAFLDMDLGQPELSPPGLCNLHIVRSPLLGPAHTHMHPAELGYFFGDVSPKSNPDEYLNTFEALLGHYRAVCAPAGLPLVVNTQGWVRGIGLDLLRACIGAAAPHHVVQIQGAARTRLFEVGDWVPRVPWSAPQTAKPPTRSTLHIATAWDEAVLGSATSDGAALDDDGGGEVSGSEVAADDAPATPVPDSSEGAGGSQVAPSPSPPPPGEAASRPTRRAVRSAQDLRSLRFACYFIPGLDEESRAARIVVHSSSNLARQLMQRVPVSIGWSDVALHIHHCEVPPSQALYAINGALVGLCIGPPRLCEHPVAFPELPRFVAESSLMPCVGIGVVVCVDPESRSIRVITPVALESLENVNVLVKGTLELPTVLVCRASALPDAHLSAECVSSTGTSKTMKSRNILKRKRLGPG